MLHEPGCTAPERTAGVRLTCGTCWLRLLAIKGSLELSQSMSLNLRLLLRKVNHLRWQLTCDGCDCCCCCCRQPSSLSTLLLLLGCAHVSQHVSHQLCACSAGCFSGGCSMWRADCPKIHLTTSWMTEEKASTQPSCSIAEGICTFPAVS